MKEVEGKREVEGGGEWCRKGGRDEGRRWRDKWSEGMRVRQFFGCYLINCITWFELHDQSTARHVLCCSRVLLSLM